MRFAFNSRQTMAAADDVETARLRRFPDDFPPPPPHGGANSSQVDAAQARRREELLLELNKARIRQDAIFRELVLTEHAMGITAAGHNPVPMIQSLQDYWHYRPPPSPVPFLEELPLHPLRSSTERSPCGCRGPPPAREPPVYPYVEWSPPRPASDAEKQQDSRLPGARTHPFDGYVELCRSLKKGALADEVSLPAAANAGALHTFHEDVTPGHEDAKSDVVDGHGNGMNLLSKSGNQNNGQRTTAATTPVDQIKGLQLQSAKYKLAGPESAAFNQQKDLPFSEPKPVQPQLGNGDEQKARVHPFNSYMELRLSPCRRAPVEETLAPVAAKAGISPMQSALSFGTDTATGQPAFGEPKDGHGMHTLGDIKNQSSGQRNAMESSKEGRMDKPAGPPSQHRPAGQENAAYNEQKVEFSEPKPVQPELGNGDEQKVRVHAFNGYMELRLSPSKRAPVEETLVPAAANAGISPMQSAPSFGKETATGKQQPFGEPKGNVDDGHGMQPLGDIRNQSSGQRKAMKPSMEGWTDKPAQPPGQHRPEGQEDAAHSQREVEFSEPKPEQPRLSNGDEQKERDVFKGYMELCLSPSKQAEVEETLVPAASKTCISPASFGKEMATGHKQTFGGETKANVEDGHGMQPPGDISNQSSGHNKAMESFFSKVKAMESAMEGRTIKPAQSPGQHRLAGKENAAYNEQRKVEFSESTPERTSYGLKRKLEDSGPLSKKQKPHRQWRCHICDVNTPSQQVLDDHLAGRRHRLRIEELQTSRSNTAEPTTKSKPVWDRFAVKNPESSRGGGSSENAAENSWWQQRRKPSEGHNSFNHRNDADAEKAADRKRALYCKLCDVQCNGEKMLVEHLGGRRHKERLGESD